MSLGIELGLEMDDIEIIQLDHIGRHIDATMKILTVISFSVLKYILFAVTR